MVTSTTLRKSRTYQILPFKCFFHKHTVPSNPVTHFTLDILENSPKQTTWNVPKSFQGFHHPSFKTWFGWPKKHINIILKL